MKQGHYSRPDAFIVLVSISNRLSWAADPDLTLLASALNLTLTLVSVATSNSAVLSLGLNCLSPPRLPSSAETQGQTDSVVWKIEQSKGRFCGKNALKVKRKKKKIFQTGRKKARIFLIFSPDFDIWITISKMSISQKSAFKNKLYLKMRQWNGKES